MTKELIETWLIHNRINFYLLGAIQENGQAIEINSLKSPIKDSERAFEKFIRKGLEENRIKGFKPHPIASLGYLISHIAS